MALTARKRNAKDVGLETPRPPAVEPLAMPGPFARLRRRWWSPLRPVERLLAAALAIAAVFLLIVPGQVPRLPLQIAAHLGGLALVLAMGRVGRTSPRGLRIARDWYPALGIVFFYSEASALNRMFHVRYFDDHVVRWEETLFRSQPSTQMHRVLPFTWLSELLHLFYFSYYLLIPALGLVFYVRGHRERFQRFLFASILTFLACMAIFTLFPVLGPNYVFERSSQTIPFGPIARFVHRLVDAGSSPGTAFPSSHVAISAVVLLAALRWARRWVLLFAPVVFGLWCGTVYGVFHYVVDGIVGSLLAGVVFGISVPLYHAIGGARLPGLGAIRRRAERAGSAARAALHHRHR